MCAVLYIRSVHTVQCVLCCTRNLYILYSTEYIMCYMYVISVHIVQLIAMLLFEVLQIIRTYGTVKPV